MREVTSVGFSRREEQKHTNNKLMQRWTEKMELKRLNMLFVSSFDDKMLLMCNIHTAKGLHVESC